MLPFLVDMARLFESFVAQWLKSHLPPHLRVQPQEKIEIDEAGNVSFQADLVIYEVQSGAVRYVLDTKYKNVAGPSPDDIAQVTAYAHFKQSPEAILIYPAPHRHLHIQRSQIRVRSLTFALAGDLEAAGQEFLSELLGSK
jgi:5-methylcytosine-specific restriction enzyme subunit McrC